VSSMHLRLLILPLLLLVAGSSSAPAQQDHKTDLQQDALLGPVKSVVTSRLSEASPEMQKEVMDGFAVIRDLNPNSHDIYSPARRSR
jgi:hypothetical protein